MDFLIGDIIKANEDVDAVFTEIGLGTYIDVPIKSGDEYIVSYINNDEKWFFATRGNTTGAEITFAQSIKFSKA